jgi:hypothetical protein
MSIRATAKRPTRRGSALLGQLLMGCGEPLRLTPVGTVRRAAEPRLRPITGRPASPRGGRGIA